MSNYIAIDSGTTNTRISLIIDYKVIQTNIFNVGAAKGVDNKNILKETVKNAIADILKSNGLCEKDISCILSCGMITSEFGLFELEHIKVPIKIEELHDSMQKCIFEDITDIPFVFTRGLKTECATIEDADMMRGEESELMGILQGEGLYILPGSHSKIVKVDDKDRIVDFKTMLTGEMISAITKGTILKDAVVISEFSPNKEYLISGMEYTQKHGINEALFKVRILKNIFGKSEGEIYNFYLGIMLSEEVKYILSQNPAKIVIGGKKAIRNALAVILKEFSCAEIIVLSDEDVDYSSIFGMIKIFEFRNFKSIGK